MYGYAVLALGQDVLAGGAFAAEKIASAYILIAAVGAG